MTPDVHQTPTWQWASGGVDPYVVEPPGSLDSSGMGGFVVSNMTPTVESNHAALLPFVQPFGPVTVSASIWSGWYTTATWELHTNGFAGPSATGTLVMGNFNHLALSDDPATGQVVASVEGVSVAAVPYVVSGVRCVGFQGNGIVNDFRVQAGAIVSP